MLSIKINDSDNEAMSHTPGPWEYSLSKDSGVVYGRGVTIADIPQDALAWRENAALIAMAPTLFEGLEEALRYLEHPDVTSIPFAKRSSVLAKQIRHMLAQAKGVA